MPTHDHHLGPDVDGDPTTWGMADQDERARSGLLFDTAWPPYKALKGRTHDLCRRYNQLDEADPERGEIPPLIFAETGEDFHVWIGANSVIMPGVTIGHDAVGAGSVVTHDVPAGWVAVGAPARPVSRITDADSVHSPDSGVFGRLGGE